MENSIDTASDTIISEIVENPVGQEERRNQDGTFKKGFSGNPAGGKPGKSMKEFAREFLMAMTTEEKVAWLQSLNDPGLLWRMAEGQPDQKTNLEATIRPQPIMAHVLLGNDGDKENPQIEETDQDSAGGNLSVQDGEYTDLSDPSGAGG